MKVRVDRDLCDLHGQCVFAAPELFRFDDDGELQYPPRGAQRARGEGRRGGVGVPDRRHRGRRE